MAKTPDPNYWGNPPITPTPHGTQPSNAPANPVPPQSAQQPPAGYYAQPTNTANAAPTAPPKKSNSVVVAIVTIIVVVLFFGMAGCAACTALVSSVGGSISAERSFDSALPPSLEEELGTSTAADFNEYARQFFALGSGDALSESELASIKSSSFKNNPLTPDSDGEYAPNVYKVGTDLPAGSYWLEGEDRSLSYFFILQPSETDASKYDVVHVNNYYGHNLIDLKDGQYFILSNEDGMEPLSKMNDTFNAPYTSGVYRVGTDIPAGSYELTAGKANDLYSYYVMSDLSFETSSYVDTGTYMDDSVKVEVVLEEGTYLELYNMKATPKTA